MLFLLFHVGKDRYALEAGRVVEVVPLLDLKKIPQGPKGMAGVFNYRGRPVPAVDLCQLMLDQPAAERLSTRIIIVNCSGPRGEEQLLGLIAEQATDTLRRDTKDFVDAGFKFGSPQYLGPILLDSQGAIQWVHENYLLSDQVRELLFSTEAAQLTA